MKKTLLLCVQLLLFAGICFAQEEISDDETTPKRFSFGFNLGNAYPLGEFAGISAAKLPMSRGGTGDTNRMSGYARKGFHYDINASCRITGNLNIVVSLAGNQNSFDLNSLNSQYNAPFPPNTVSEYTSQQYYMWQLLMGPEMNFPVSDAFSVQLRALAGITGMFSPDITYSGVLDTITYAYPKGSGFGYSISGGIKYSVSGDGALGVAFHLNVGYYGAFIRYPSYSTLVSSAAGANGYIYKVPKYMNVGLIEIGVGISLEF